MSGTPPDPTARDAAPVGPAPRRRRGARREQGPPAAAPETTDDSPDTDERAGRLRKRPRRRSTGASPMPVGPPVEPAAPLPTPANRATPAMQSGAAPSRDRRVDHAERALRGLVTTRGTQVPWAAATRAREVSAPSAADMERAAEEVVVVRRNYAPPEPLRTARSGDFPRPRRRTD